MSQKRKPRYGVDIIQFVESDAKHWYARVWWIDEDDQEMSEDLWYVMSWPEARQLNQESVDDDWRKEGSTELRFLSKERVLIEARAYFKREFPKAREMEIGQACMLDNDKVTLR